MKARPRLAVGVILRSHHGKGPYRARVLALTPTTVTLRTHGQRHQRTWTLPRRYVELPVCAWVR